jgi:hypothetical protein
MDLPKSLSYKICYIFSISIFGTIIGLVLAMDILSFVFIPVSFVELLNSCNDYSSGTVVSITNPKNIDCTISVLVNTMNFDIKDGIMCHYINTNDSVTIAYNHFKQNESTCSYFINSAVEYPSPLYSESLILIYVMFACWGVTIVFITIGITVYIIDQMNKKQKYDQIYLVDLKQNTII